MVLATWHAERQASLANGKLWDAMSETVKGPGPDELLSGEDSQSGRRRRDWEGSEDEAMPWQERWRMETGAVGEVRWERKVGLVRGVGEEGRGGLVSTVTGRIGERREERLETSSMAKGRSASEGVCCIATRRAVPGFCWCL